MCVLFCIQLYTYSQDALQYSSKGHFKELINPSIDPRVHTICVRNQCACINKNIAIKTNLVLG